MTMNKNLIIIIITENIFNNFFHFFKLELAESETVFFFFFVNLQIQTELAKKQDRNVN